MASSLFFLTLPILGVPTALFVIFAGPLMTPARPRLRRRPGAARPDREPRAPDVPDRRAAPLSGRGGRDAQLARPLQRPGARAVAWNLVIIAALVVPRPVPPDDDEIYAYAIGDPGRHGRAVRAAAAVAAGAGRAPDVPARLARPARPTRAQADAAGDDRARPINLSLLINSLFGTLVSDEAPAAIDKAFRIYQLPQGLFSISIATSCSDAVPLRRPRRARRPRRTMANGMRQSACS